MYEHSEQPRSTRTLLSWLLPFIALGFGERVVEANPASGQALALALLGGVVAGTAWQLLYRRDLVDRLTVFATIIVLWIVIGAVTDAHMSLWSSEGSEFAALGVLLALVYTEHWQRWRASRLTSRARAKAVPARQ